MDPITIDPGVIGAASWRELGQLLQSLWLAVLFVVLFASNMILGHIMLPSFVSSGHVPAAWGKTRPVFYLLAVVSFVIAMFFISRATDFAGVLRNFWPDYWI
jgi:hypothetical protein